MSKSVTLHVGDIRLGATMAGVANQPGLLLLHGWPQSRSVYDNVIEQLSTEFFVIDGLKATGAENVESLSVANSGELLPIEAPKAFVDLVREFGRRRISR